MSNKVTVKLRAGHPKRAMRARLTNDDVVIIDDAAGIEIDSDQVSDEMIDCGWFEISDAEPVKKPAKAEPEPVKAEDDPAEEPAPAKTKKTIAKTKAAK